MGAEPGHKTALRLLCVWRRVGPLALTVHFEKLVAGFSRYHKYTLGTEAARASPEGGARLPKAWARYKRPG